MGLTLSGNYLQVAVKTTTTVVRYFFPISKVFLCYDSQAQKIVTRKAFGGEPKDLTLILSESDFQVSVTENVEVVVFIFK